MKIAIVHDWLVTNGGAEKVLKEILEIFPNSEIFTLVDFLDEKEKRDILNNKKVNTSFIQNLPFAKKHFRNYLPLFPTAIESLDLSNYDLIISSSWAFAKGIKKNKNQLHISYCHTPIRYAWDLYEEYTKPLNQPKKFLVQKTLKYIRKWDKKTANRVDCFIANSNFVKKRIERIYNRNSTVIYPPADNKKFTLSTIKEDFYLTAARLVSYKKTKLIVESFNKMPDKKLIVIGKGEEYKILKKIAKSNIQILGYQSDEKLIKYMQKAKAFIYAAVEDFGIVPVEAMLCGTPVIALNEGGTAESVQDNITGVLFEKQTKEDIIKAVNKFEKLKFDSSLIRNNALKFSKENFKYQFKKVIDEIYKKNF